MWNTAAQKNTDTYLCVCVCVCVCVWHNYNGNRFWDIIWEKYLFHISSVCEIKCLGEIWKKVLPRVVCTYSFDDLINCHNLRIYELISPKSVLFFPEKLYNCWMIQLRNKTSETLVAIAVRVIMLNNKKKKKQQTRKQLFGLSMLTLVSFILSLDYWKEIHKHNFCLQSAEIT